MKAKRSRKIKKARTEMVGNIEIVTMDVPNPDWTPDRDQVPGFPKNVRATVNCRESPIVWMLAHGQVSETQAKAASRFRQLYEAAGSSDLKAMDYMKEPVDGSGFPDIITDRKMAAAKELSEVHKLLGLEGFRLVANVCGDCIWVRDLGHTQWARLRIADHLRDCLNVLAIHWGYQSPKTRTWRKTG